MMGIDEIKLRTLERDNLLTSRFRYPIIISEILLMSMDVTLEA
jgi:hypothetical protein